MKSHEYHLASVVQKKTAKIGSCSPFKLFQTNTEKSCFLPLWPFDDSLDKSSFIIDFFCTKYKVQELKRHFADITGNCNVVRAVTIQAIEATKRTASLSQGLYGSQRLTSVISVLVWNDCLPKFFVQKLLHFLFHCYNYFKYNFLFYFPG